MTVRIPKSYIEYDIIDAQELKEGDKFITFSDHEGTGKLNPKQHVLVDSAWETVTSTEGVHGPGVYTTRGFFSSHNRMAIIKREV